MGFRVTLVISTYISRCSWLRRYFDTLHLDIRLVRALAEIGHFSLVLSTAGRDSPKNGRPLFLKGGTPRLWHAAVVEIGRNSEDRMGEKQPRSDILH